MSGRACCTPAPARSELVEMGPRKRPVRGSLLEPANVADGSPVLVHGLRMQPFRRDLLAVDAGHVRTTAVAVADSLDGASERQSPK